MVAPAWRLIYYPFHLLHIFIWVTLPEIASSAYSPRFISLIDLVNTVDYPELSPQFFTYPPPWLLTLPLKVISPRVPILVKY